MQVMATNFEEQREFAKWVLNVGDGSLPAIAEEGASVALGVSMDSLYMVEFLNILQFSGIANHELELKVGVPILLLRNLNQSIGLCNGTRLIICVIIAIMSLGVVLGVINYHAWDKATT